MLSLLSVDPIGAFQRFYSAPLIRKIMANVQDSVLHVDMQLDASRMGDFPVSYDVWRIKIQHIVFEFERSFPGSLVTFAERYPRRSDLDSPTDVGLYLRLRQKVDAAHLRGMPHYELQHLLRVIYGMRYTCDLAATLYENTSRKASHIPPPKPATPAKINPRSRDRLGLM